jgi:hypothetical protein
MSLPSTILSSTTVSVAPSSGADTAKADTKKSEPTKKESVTSGSHNLVRLSLELGLAVNDYNSGFVNNLDEIGKITLAYLTVVKIALKDKVVASREIRDYFALIGQSWGSIVPRFENEYLDDLKE